MRPDEKLIREIDQYLIYPFLVDRVKEHLGRDVLGEDESIAMQIYGPALLHKHMVMIERTYSELEPRLAKYTKKERRFHFDCMKDLNSWFDYQFPPLSKRMKENIRKEY
ncbi:MAG: hypothetical protein F4073_08425 [Rhodobacteraceae bacterium]|nr:hypothetical protein [Paracoccaceae bacterium]MYF46329.1 hypothetical protein [Paracoccaceae bacterium]MYI91964.1 hypothetical protein [Paracoccaceae bacterium]